MSRSRSVRGSYWPRTRRCRRIRTSFSSLRRWQLSAASPRGSPTEMNTPVASVRAALGELDKLVQEYAEAVNNPNMSAETHRGIAGEMREAIRLGTNAAVKVAGFVRGMGRLPISAKASEVASMWCRSCAIR